MSKKENPYGWYIVANIFGLFITCAFLFAFIVVCLVNGAKPHQTKTTNTKPALQDDWECCTPDHEKRELQETKKRTLEEYYERITK